MSNNLRNKELSDMKDTCDSYIQKIAEQEEKNTKITELITQLTKALDELTLKNKKIYDAKLEWEYTFDGISDLIFLTDLEGRIIRANKSFKDKMGLDYKAFLGRECQDVFRCNHSSLIECPRSSCIISKTKVCKIVYFDFLKCYYEVVSSPLYDANDNFYGTVQIMRNIDDYLLDLCRNEKNDIPTLVKLFFSKLDNNIKDQILKSIGEYDDSQ